MSDFTSGFWSVYISVITVASIIACAIFLRAFTVRRGAAGDKVDTTGHVWDEDLKEWNNPLPNWWRWLFYITIVFGLSYLVFYPGLGAFKGVDDWTSRKQYTEEVARADAQYGPLFAKYAQMPIPAVAADPEAKKIGERLFLNYCSQCHGSDARGGRGFPNLTDRDWIYGGTPEAIQTTILGGRNGVMPPLAAAVGDGEAVRDVAQYVLSLSGRTHDSLRASRGKAKFAAVCAACHGADGKGNPQIGAPNLTDDVWLYGGTEAAIVEAITKGRAGQMPAFKDFLGDDKVHLLAAYVWSLSNTAQPAVAASPLAK
jgi:cytochrome c oxidase cbb3-type subunit 3